MREVRRPGPFCSIRGTEDREKRARAQPRNGEYKEEVNFPLWIIVFGFACGFVLGLKDVIDGLDVESIPKTT